MVIPVDIGNNGDKLFIASLERDIPITTLHEEVS